MGFVSAACPVSAHVLEVQIRVGLARAAAADVRGTSQAFRPESRGRAKKSRVEME